MRTKGIIYCAVCAALNCLGAVIVIPVGVLPVTMQTFFACMSGIIAGPVWGPVSQIVYIILGLTGLPVFASGAGIAYVLTPGFGYLIGFIFTSGVAGLLTAKLKKHTLFSYMRISAISLIPLYLIGIAYQLIIMKTVLNLKDLSIWIALGSIPLYILSDILSLIVLSIIAPRLRYSITYRRNLN